MLVYGDLPNMRLEGETIATLARHNGFTSVRLLTGADATEESLRASVSPYLLHFTTHGT